MTRRDPEERYEAWLEAEARGDEIAADAALAALFEGLPLEAPREGFAAATLARVQGELAADAAAPVTAAAPAATRWAAALLALLSTGTLGLSIAAVTLLPRLAVGGVVATFNRIVGAAWEWIASGVALWGEAAEWSGILTRVLALPGVAGSLLVTAVTTLVAFSLLRRILQQDLPEKEPIYVQHR